MPNILTKLKLTELSLVDTPANPEALAPIFKANSEEGDTKDMADTIKMDDDMKAKLKPYMDKGMSEEDALKAYEEDMQNQKETTKAENERLRKALIENGFVIKADTIEKKAETKAEEFIEVDGEQIAKSAIPAPVLKRLEEAEAEKAQTAIEKKAEEFPNLNKGIAVNIVKSGLLDDEKFLEFVRAVDAMFEKTMIENGEKTTDPEMDSASDKLNKMVAELAKSENITKEQAFTKFSQTKEGRELVNKAYYNKEA